MSSRGLTHGLQVPYSECYLGYERTPKGSNLHRQPLGPNISSFAFRIRIAAHENRRALRAVLPGHLILCDVHIVRQTRKDLHVSLLSVKPDRTPSQGMLKQLDATRSGLRRLSGQMHTDKTKRSLQTRDFECSSIEKKSSVVHARNLPSVLLLPLE